MSARPIKSNDKIFKMSYVPVQPIQSLSDTSNVSQFYDLGVTDTLITKNFRVEGNFTAGNNTIQQVGTPQNATDAATKSYVDTSFAYISPPYLICQNYGALGNGVHDDTTNIQNAINAASSSGYALFFPPGNYVTSGTLTVPSSVYLIGSGTKTNIIQSSTNASIFQVGSNCRIEKMQLSSSSQSFTSSTLVTSAPLIVIGNVVNVLIQDISCYLCYAFLFVQGAQHTIKNCQVFSTYYGILLDTAASNCCINTFISVITNSSTQAATVAMNNASTIIVKMISGALLIQNMIVDRQLYGIQLPVQTSASSLNLSISTSNMTNTTTMLYLGSGTFATTVIEQVSGSSITNGIVWTDTNHLSSSSTTLQVNQLVISTCSRGIWIDSTVSGTVSVMQATITGNTNEALRNESTALTLKLLMLLANSNRLYNVSTTIEDLMTPATLLSANSNNMIVSYGTQDAISATSAGFISKGGIVSNKSMLVGNTIQIGTNLATSGPTSSTIGNRVSIPSGTHTFSNTTTNNAASVYVDQITLNSNAVTSVPSAASIWIKGPPISGTNTTLSSRYAMYLENGDMFLTVPINYNNDDVVKQQSALLGSIQSNTLYSIPGLAISSSSSTAEIQLVALASTTDQTTFELNAVNTVQGTSNWKIVKHYAFGKSSGDLFQNTVFTITAAGQVQVNFGTISATTCTIKWRLQTIA